MNITGFVYVNISNLNLSRESVFYSNTKSYKHFYMNICVSAVTFFIGHNVCLKSAHGLSDYPNCHLFDKNQTFEYNFNYWVPGFIIGLQYTHLDVDALRKFSLSPEFIVQWTFFEWSFLTAVLSGLAVLLYHCCDYWIQIGMLDQFLEVLSV